MGRKYFILLLLLAFATGAEAQRGAQGNDTTIKNTTIEIIQSYKPQVKQAPKPEWMPQLPPADTTHPAFTYDVPQQTLYYTYSSLPLRPLELGRDTLNMPFRNYVKLGGGNLSTIYLDAGIGGITGKNYETAIHLHHISQAGTLENQQSAMSGVEAEGAFHGETNDFHAVIIGERNQFSYYGGDQAAAFGSDSMKQTYTTIGIAADLKNREDTNTVISYHPSVNASLYTARNSTSETNFGFNAPFIWKVDSSFNALIGIDGALTDFKSGAQNTGNNFVEIKPGLSLLKDEISGHALAGFALGMGNKKYLLPDLLASWLWTSHHLTFSLGWQALVKQNTYQQLTGENPFMYLNYLVQQTRSDEVFVQVRGSKGDHFSFSGRASYWAYNNLPVFLNDIGSEKEFYVNYLNVNATSLSLSAHYQEANVWSAGLTCDLYNYFGSTSVIVYAWQVPDKKLRADFIITPFPKLTLTAYLAVLGGIYARNAALQPVKLDMITDLGGNAEYQVIPRLSAFLQLNNLLNQKYERWYGYPSYGLNIYGGLRLKF